MSILDDLNPQVGHSNDQVKMCARCREQKPIGCFNRNKTTKDGLYAYCRSCQREIRKGYRESKKDMYLVSNRFDAMIKGQLDLNVLTIQELTGGFIVLEDGTKQDVSVAGKAFQNKFGLELTRRLNKVLRKGSSRALEVIYEIMDSDLVEPADRFKAAQWWTERVMGKTPDILHIGTETQPHESIFETLVGGSREDHRAKQLGQAIDAEVVDIQDANVVEDETGSRSDNESDRFVGEQVLQRSGQDVDSEAFDGMDADNRTANETDSDTGFGISGGRREDHRIRVGTDVVQNVGGLAGNRTTDNRAESSHSDVGRNVGTVFGEDEATGSAQQQGISVREPINDGNAGKSSQAEQAANAIVLKQQEKKALRKRLNDAKKRRFAARAVGATSLDAAPWLIDWRVTEDGLRACLVPPSAQTPAKLSVIAANAQATDDEQFVATQRANILQMKAQKLQEKAQKALGKANA